MSEPRIGSRRRRLRLLVPAVLALLVIVAVVATSAGSGEPQYRLAAATPGDVTVVLDAAGTVQPVDRAELSFPVAGTVAEVVALPGDQVAAGAVLARLDTTVLDAQVAAAESQVASARARLDADRNGSPTGGAAATPSALAPVRSGGIAGLGGARGPGGSAGIGGIALPSGGAEGGSSGGIGALPGTVPGGVPGAAPGGVPGAGGLPNPAAEALRLAADAAAAFRDARLEKQRAAQTALTDARDRLDTAGEACVAVLPPAGDGDGDGADREHPAAPGEQPDGAGHGPQDAAGTGTPESANPGPGAPEPGTADQEGADPAPVAPEDTGPDGADQDTDADTDPDADAGSTATPAGYRTGPPDGEPGDPDGDSGSGSDADPEDLAGCLQALRQVLDAQTEVGRLQDGVAAADSAFTDTLGVLVQAARQHTGTAPAPGAPGVPVPPGAGNGGVGNGSAEGVPGAPAAPAPGGGSAGPLPGGVPGGLPGAVPDGGSAGAGLPSGVSGGLPSGLPGGLPSGLPGGLGRSGPASAAQLDADRAAVQAAEAQLATARQNLAQATLTSPISGTVGLLELAVGDVVTGGSSGTAQAVVLAPELGHQVDVLVGEGDIARVAVGNAVTVTADGADGPVEGTVSAIGLLPESGAGGSTGYPVTIALPADAGPYSAGQGAAVQIRLADVVGVLTVPTSAVHADGVEWAVDVLRDGAVQAIPVQVGAVGAVRAEIVSGLRDGDQVVVADPTQPLPGFTGVGGLR